MRELPERVEEFLKYMKNIRRKSINTIDGYEVDLRMLFRYLRYKKELSKQMSIKDINKIDISNINDNFIKAINISDLNNFISYLAEVRDNQEAAQARKIATIRSFYKYMFKNDLVDNNISLKLENVEIPKRNPIYLTLSETKTLANVVRESDKRFSIRNITIITIFLNTGVRLSELVGLDINNINFEYKTISVIGKGNKQRTIPMNQSTEESLIKYFKYRNTIEDTILPEHKEAVFISSKNCRIGKRSIERIVKEYVKETGLDKTKKITPHKFRHTSATLMHKYGKVDIRTLQKILGHSSPTVTQIYTSVDDEQMQEAVNSMPEF